MTHWQDMLMYSDRQLREERAKARAEGAAAERDRIRQAAESLKYYQPMPNPLAGGQDLGGEILRWQHLADLIGGES